MSHRILRIAAVLICIFAILFGLARMGIGAAMIGQDQGWWAVAGEMTEALVDTHRFLGEKNGQALVAMTSSQYFGVIVAMGAVLLAGGIAYLNGRRRAGLSLLAVYLIMHGGLFLNFLTINRKISYLIAGAVLWGLLLWRHRLAK